MVTMDDLDLTAYAQAQGVDVPMMTRAYRVDMIGGDQMVTPFGDGLGTDVHATAQSALPCLVDDSHTPPVVECSCGVYAVRDVRELRTILKSMEFESAAAAMNLRPKVHPRHHDLIKPTNPANIHQRVAVTTGWLADAVQHQVNRERLVAFFDDGTDSVTETMQQRAARVSGFSSKNLYSIGVTGDPPTTMRGSLFVKESMVVQLQPEDDPHGLTLDMPVNFVIGSDVDDLLSSVIGRYADNPVKGREWWQH